MIKMYVLLHWHILLRNKESGTQSFKAKIVEGYCRNVTFASRFFNFLFYMY